MCSSHEHKGETLQGHSWRDPFGSMEEPPAMVEKGKDLGCRESFTTKTTISKAKTKSTSYPEVANVSQYSTEWILG